MWIMDDPGGGDEPLIESNTCLLPMIDSKIWFLFRLHRHYDNGILLVAGGLLDQPHAYIETMEIISEVLKRGH